MNSQLFTKLAGKNKNRIEVLRASLWTQRLQRTIAVNFGHKGEHLKIYRSAPPYFQSDVCRPIVNQIPNLQTHAQTLIFFTLRDIPNSHLCNNRTTTATKLRTTYEMIFFFRRKMAQTPR